SEKMIDAAFINKYIDKIYVTPIDDGIVEISVKIFTGKTVEKHLQNVRSRTGHTFKKMIESYEKNMK
ncbi:MAG: recombinase family protein, partial [Clostridia bacterium]|nr:recombinase family protein [Clostridia bacterium]